MHRNWLIPIYLILIVVPKGGETMVFGGGISVGIGGNIGGGGGSGSDDSKLEVAYNVLQAWKSSITSDPLGILHTWVGPNVCSYKGIFCAESQGGIGIGTSNALTIAGIDLNHASLQGTLVKELSLLTDMTLLHLNTNRFSGTIPTTFKDLVSLQELDLSNNEFSGTFPLVTLYMPNLIYLDLRYNKFSGTLPQDIFNSRLDAILLNNNDFQGELPQSLGNSQASVINLANNKLTGNIPASFGLLGSKAKEILLLNNQLTGCLPEGIGLFSDIEVFDVSFNSLMGHLPDTLSCLDQIEVLNLGHNKLSGELPDIVCSLKSLVNLTVSYNFFSGFSQDCTKLFFRNVGFDFSDNCIPNRQMQRPQPDCSAVPGGSLSCLRIPSVQPIVCGAMGVLSGILGDLNPTPP